MPHRDAVFTGICTALVTPFDTRGEVDYTRLASLIDEQISAGVSAVCAKDGANICEITQSVLSEYFAMIMLAELDGLNVTFAEFADELSALGKEKVLAIHTMHEDIFNTMHHI